VKKKKRGKKKNLPYKPDQGGEPLYLPITTRAVTGKKILVSFLDKKRGLKLLEDLAKGGNDCSPREGGRRGHEERLRKETRHKESKRAEIIKSEHRGRQGSSPRKQERNLKRLSDEVHTLGEKAKGFFFSRRRNTV